MNPLDEYLDPPEAKRYADALRGAREGDPHALDELVDELSPMLWRVARRQGLDRSAAEDVVQSTWLTLMHKLSEIDKPAALPSWLATTARREAWRVSRRGHQEQPADHQEWDAFVADQVDLGEDVIERMGLAPRYKTLWNVVKQLPPKCRGLIQVIAYTDRPDYSKVAEALKMPRGSIGPNRGRCLAKLRELLHSNPEWN
ncbi:MAG TPA: sigma-70 family RNA polymerase sigma factor [Stackebrandtia sp.]|jgi:RNA polymerase sigma factor (sigma-70 family)|uniref:RNA polymerase sigma factor n=1 Tax=Stackebrandtia sp. TaxID=2023065 RepID=UPI002D64343D|nr:sigma-70 family RNA polymerase sigma factor [Stackebrandtia sp.]HZE40719.1 sigma-70 family RNA polymerase sigma factor [Stackebrandtia sp.]